MFVSLLISTYNWENALAVCLKSVFAQTVKPDEIVIADDGSREDTRLLIENIQRETTIPIIHVWHEDKGFRKTSILNKALLQVNYPYIIQIDGDVVLEKHFIADHLELAEPGCFVCGSRVLLGAKLSRRLLRSLQNQPLFFKQSIPFMLNGFRSKMLRHFLAKRYGKCNVKRIRGCNMAFWKDDLLMVNGYNESLEMWGQEDVEFGCRLIHAGIQKKQLKMGGVEFHLYHKLASRANLNFHEEVLEKVVRNRTAWCENGIKKYN